jgi:hypothetical protein
VGIICSKHKHLKDHMGCLPTHRHGHVSDVDIKSWKTFWACFSGRATYKRAPVKIKDK